MNQLRPRVVDGFVEAYGAAPSLIASAPGRVNLIGEHTDYNDGFVLPMAIGVGTLVAARPRDDDLLRIAALDLGVESSFSLSGAIEQATAGDWSNYPRGVAAALEQQGLALRGAELAIAGDVPQGAGLSSSASLEVAVGMALAAIAGQHDYDRTALALAGQSAEHRYAGCNCGIMDQLVSARAGIGSATLIDCRSLDCQPVKIPDDLAVLIVHSGISRELVDGEYNDCRQQCEAAAHLLGVEALRDADLKILAAHRTKMDSVVYRRARHVISENDRTRAAAIALAKRDLAALGELMTASHASMRDDFEITTPEIDALAAMMNHALNNFGGARMTGGGFGGAVIAIAERGAVEALAGEVAASYRTPCGDAPRIMIETPQQGASLI